MAANGRSGASQDPLERYRQALRRQAADRAPSAVVAEPPTPEVQPASDEPLELDEPLVEEEPTALVTSHAAAGESYPPGENLPREDIQDQGIVPAGTAEHEAQRAEAMFNRLAQQIKLGVDKTPLADEPHAAEEPLDLGEPLAEEEPLDLGEPLAAEEPLELGEPLDTEEPLELGEPLAEDAPLGPGEPPTAEEPLELEAPLDLGEPLEAAGSSNADGTRTAADWLGLDDTFAEDDPLGLDDPQSLEATTQTAPDHDPGDAAAGDDVPEELQGTLARYQMAMSKLRSQKSAAPPDPPAVQSGPSEANEAQSGDELLDRYQQARLRRQDLEEDASESGTYSISREALDHPIDDEIELSETEDANDLVRDFPTRARVTRNSRQRNRPASVGWTTRAVTFAALLFAALPVQWLVYRQLGVSFALEDLGAGLSALLPAALILLLARPTSGRGQVVMVLGSAAVGLIGSAGFAYGLSLLQNQLPQGTSLVFGMLLSLGLFTAVWGPLFLILVPILSRMSPAARSDS